MKNRPNVILLELNELTPRLMDRFIDEGHLPNFRRFREQSEVFTTDAEEEGENLNPWIQWVTVHTGLSFEEHGVFRLGEGDRIAGKGIIDLVSRAGRPVLQCGSMNVRYQAPLNGIALPDPWATDVDPYPASLQPYFRFVQKQVLEHTAEESPLRLSEVGAFIGFMARHGLSPSTILEIVRQLLRERSGHYGWQRVAILDRLQWDVFRWHYRRIQPELATFFLNSVAHLQHTHWRNMEPEKFSLQPTPEEQEEFRDAILFGYRKMDDLIGRFMALAGPETTIILSTALSQQACVSWEETGGKRFYRPRNFEVLTAFAGIESPHTCSPVMSEEFSLEFESENLAKDAARKLESLTVDGAPAFWVDQSGNEIYSGCRIHSQLAEGVLLEAVSDGRSVPFFDLLYQADSLKSGVHDSDGLLWVRGPGRAQRVHSERVSLTCVAPMILQLLGVDVPEYMKGTALL